MILRFLAFRLTDPHLHTQDDFDHFLRETMRRLNDLPQVTVAELRNEFDLAMMAAKAILGPYAFRKRDRDGGSRRLPINKALFEAVSVNLATTAREQVTQLVKWSDEVERRFIGLMSDVDFQLAISQGTGDPAKVRYRFGAIRDIFEKVAPV
jgi:hypothetical protein